MSDADGIQICVKTRVEHGLGQTKHIFIRSIRAISKRDKARSLFSAASLRRLFKQATSRARRNGRRQCNDFRRRGSRSNDISPYAFARPYRYAARARRRCDTRLCCRRACRLVAAIDRRWSRGSRRHGHASRGQPAVDPGRSLRVRRSGAGRRQDLLGLGSRECRAGVLAHRIHAARPGTQYPRHRQYAPRLAVVRPLGRHVRRRRLHRPHRRLQLRLLRPRACRGHSRPAGRAARQERRGRRAEHHHGCAVADELRAN